MSFTPTLRSVSTIQLQAAAGSPQRQAVWVCPADPRQQYVAAIVAAGQPLTHGNDRLVGTDVGDVEVSHQRDIVRGIHAVAD